MKEKQESEFNCLEWHLARTLKELVAEKSTLIRANDPEIKFCYIRCADLARAFNRQKLEGSAGVIVINAGYAGDVCIKILRIPVFRKRSSWSIWLDQYWLDRMIKKFDLGEKVILPEWALAS
jgi:hypothetical protein